jgi:hypothetical protein
MVERYGYASRLNVERLGWEKRQSQNRIPQLACRVVSKSMPRWKNKFLTRFFTAVSSEERKLQSKLKIK